MSPRLLRGAPPLGALALALNTGCGTPQQPAAGASTTAGSCSLTTDPTGTGGGLTLAPPPFDWVGFVHTGQSLSVGTGGTPVVSARQPYRNLKLFDASPSPAYDGVGDVLSLVPLTAPLRPLDPSLPPIAYPNNIYGETPCEGMGNQLAASTLAATGADWITVQTNVGESGQPISSIEKGGASKAFAATLYEVTAISGLAAKQGKTYGVGGIFLTHGESDADNADYEAHVAELMSDYDADLRAITGQKEPIPFFATQQSTFPDSLGPSVSTLAAWRLGATPGYFCVGPRYAYEYAGDSTHLTPPSYRRLGEKYAEAYFEVAVTKHGWRPLAPTSATLAGQVITVAFEVPYPPLAWEETLPRPHQSNWVVWAAGRGFEVSDSTGPRTITGVAIEGSTVRVTLDGPPTGKDLTVMYALHQDATGYHGGSPLGRHGQLRDSDPFAGDSARPFDCQVTEGSNVIRPVSTGDFVGRGATELASADGLPGGATVLSVSGDTMTLSAPWKGATGTACVTLQNDHRNYAVHFALPVE